MKKIFLVAAFFLAMTSALFAAQTKEQRDIADCEMIGLPAWRDDCFETLSKKLPYYYICLKISDPQRRERCAMVHPPMSMDDCALNHQPRDYDSCLVLLKNTVKDFSICKKIGDPKIKKSCYACSPKNKDIDVCLQYRARELQDKSICDLLSSKKEISQCLAGMTLVIPVAGCENPQSLQEYKLCRQFQMAQQEQNKKSTGTSSQARKERAAQIREEKSRQKAMKLDQAREARQAKIDEKRSKKQKLDQAREAAMEEKKARIQKTRDEKQSKIENQNLKIQTKKEAREARAKEREEKIRQAKAAREAKIEERKQQIQQKKEARAQARNQRLEKQKEAREKKTHKTQIAKSVPEPKIFPVSKSIPTQPVAHYVEDLAKMGCTSGFGGWSVPPKKPMDETACDKANVREFEAVLNHCVSDKIDPKVLLYDLDNDGCVTCKDFIQWKSENIDLFKSSRRSTDGKSLISKSCQVE